MTSRRLSTEPRQLYERLFQSSPHAASPYPPSDENGQEVHLRSSKNTSDPIFTFHSEAKGTSSYSWPELKKNVDLIGKNILQAYTSTSANYGIVAILASTQEQQALHYLGALSAGLCPAILTPPSPKIEREWFAKNLTGVLKAIAPALVVTDIADELIAVDTTESPAITFLNSDTLLQKATQKPRPIDEGTAFVQFSSGTTGIKKGVQIGADAVFAQIDSYGKALNISNNDSIVSWLPLYHDMGFFTSLHLSLALNVPVTFLDSIEWVTKPSIYLQAVSRNQATLGWHPNFAFNFMAKRVRSSDSESFDLSSLRMLINCSEPATFASQQAFLDRFQANGLRKNVFSGCYAMAETTFAVTHGEDSQYSSYDENGPVGAHVSLRKPVLSVGAPIDGATLSVRDDNGVEVDEGILGELWIQAPFLARQYVDESATNAAFVDNWYRSGDLGYRRGNDFYVTGRKKDVLIVAGNNVFPEDIEAAVGETSGFRPGRVAAFAEFDERLQTERVIVLAEPAKAGEPNIVEAMQHLTGTLQLSNTSIEIVPPGWLIKSSSGKIARRSSAEKWQRNEGD